MRKQPTIEIVWWWLCLHHYYHWYACM